MSFAAPQSRTVVMPARSVSSGVEHAADGRDRDAVVADLLEEVGHAVVAEVDMAVDEPRQQRAATAVDDAAGLEGRCQGGRTDPCDTLVLDHDRAVL